ncbi:unnamed protein product [Lactuca virosa]|uniref:RRM domain-containing protein n=1 Tax=Lactuca virosa TaxID=75947 RepID=A0AAU9LC96_9ASTR|nr:unnamed protein product [Lactuca virosa]
MFFAFIRYEDVKDKESLVKSLNQVRCRNCIAKVNIAKYVKRPPRHTTKSNQLNRTLIPNTKWNNICKGKSFTDVVSGNNMEYDTPLPLLLKSQWFF